ncbi:hypothetical protein KEM56_000441 [Ascosphaera pollenicola]|nr:hypothetical protein KEM56_000441 [Ascosphaera pollenicola]
MPAFTAEDKQALSNWLKRTCRRAGVRRQDAAAAATPADPNAAATPAAGQGDQNQAATDDAVANDQGAVTSPAAATPTPTPTPTDSASASATSASQSPVYYSEENVDKPSDWPRKNARWLAMACILVVGFTAFTIFLVWLKRRIHRKRAEERARLQEQALEAAAASSRGGAPPMEANPIPPGSSGSEQQPGANAAVRSNPDSEAITPLVGFSHAPGTRYTAYDHMLAEQQLQEEEQQRQQSQSGSARSRISALFGRGPKSPQDMISGGPANGWGRPVHESPHEFDGGRLSYPAPPIEVERSHTPRLK